MKDGDIKTTKGILVNEYFETSIPDVYAVGDCAEFHRHPTGRNNIEQVWYTGRMMGETVAQTICNNKTAYQPGVWFNSAKFFNIEYQTYGNVKNELTANEAEFYWEKGNIALHFVYEKDTKKLIGVNSFDMRLRHKIFNRWLTNGETIEFVLEHLKDANFDTEFYKKHEREIINQYNLENNTQLKAKNRNWKRIFA